MTRKLLMAVVVLVVAGSQTGCLFSGVQKGTVTTNYDQKGRVTSVVEDSALGDPNTETHRSARPEGPVLFWGAVNLAWFLLERKKGRGWRRGCRLALTGKTRARIRGQVSGLLHDCR